MRLSVLMLPPGGSASVVIYWPKPEGRTAEASRANLAELHAAIAEVVADFVRVRLAGAERLLLNANREGV